MPTLGAILVLALQQGIAATPGYSSPPSGDTVGYWQQRVSYTITALLDETAQRVRARGTLRYVNNSPDTLREMYVHQYLNAFRPGSKWSDVDEREGRERFQRLQDPHHGYERFVAPVRVNGVAVLVEYPGAPDSTVARFELPTPLAPRDSLVVTFEWDARPSTLPRRQGRRGRHWDLAQWYPKVAVYDRGGWQHNALQPAGEFYGEFGTYDVTLLVAPDQVIAATGVPVSGDPGWARVLRAGSARAGAHAYDAVPPPSVDASAPSGFRAVRFLARDVHHFAWTASPDYRYEGAAFARPRADARFPTWDTISVHVLWRAGDDTTWGGLRVARRTITALRWLETIYGPYAYPQMTVVHRLDGGGTEFPMMQMNGSPSLGLILHEGGHVFTYGILANNEWRSGWMDEGLTSYQTAWAQLLTPQERQRAAVVDQPTVVKGYRAKGIRMALPRFERINVDQAERDLRGTAQPIATIAHDFRDFDTYNDMIYDRAEIMYGQLRDVLGDTLFVAFLRDYYARWALKHVDERAMRASVQRVSGRDLSWFFDQWVHRTGVTDYSLDRVTQTRDTAGMWITETTLRRRGEYRHPMPVGVRTSAGWTFASIGEGNHRQTVRIATKDNPLEVRLDPYHVTWDWDRRNDVRRRRVRWNFDWPFLTQTDREREMSLWTPIAWYSEAGGFTIGLRSRTSYLGWIDNTASGAAWPTTPLSSLPPNQRIQYWAKIENPRLWMPRPAVGWRLRTALLDGITMLDIGRARTDSSARRGARHSATLTVAHSAVPAFAPELWDSTWTLDFAASSRIRVGPQDEYWFVDPSWVAGLADGKNGYLKVDASFGRVDAIGDQGRLAVRGYAGMMTKSTPSQRALLLNAEDPVSTFENHWWRPAGAAFKRPGVNWLPLGGAALRGFRWDLSAERVAALNVDLARRVSETRSATRDIGFWAHAFADFAHTGDRAAAGRTLVDAGIGLRVMGRLYDRDVTLRIDSPFFVNEPSLAIDRGRAGRDRFAPRWVIAFNDIW